MMSSVLSSTLLLMLIGTAAVLFVTLHHLSNNPEDGTRRQLRVMPMPAIGRYYKDPKTSELKAIDETTLLPDGVLYERRLSKTRRICDFFLNPDPKDPPITRIHFHFPDCLEPQLGNRLGEVYGRYLLANAAGVPYTMTCGNPEEGNESVLLPGTMKQISMLKLLQVNNEVPGPPPRDSLTGQSYSAFEMCSMCRPVPSWQSNIGLDMMSDIIREDMWKVASTDIGQSFQADDAVIHLRLGDALSSHKDDNDEGIGLLPHKAYSQLLRRAEMEKGPIRTISIVTMPFSRKDVRQYERHLIDRSRLVTEDLVRHLQQNFPSASVTIHNGHDETPIKGYARLIRAKKIAVCGSSTFCTDPVLAVREGLGYVFRAEKHSPWAIRAATKYDNIRTYKVPRLSNNYIQKLSDSQMIMWLRNQDPNVNAGELVINGPPLIRNSKEQVPGNAVV